MLWRISNNKPGSLRAALAGWHNSEPPAPAPTGQLAHSSYGLRSGNYAARRGQHPCGLTYSGVQTSQTVRSSEPAKEASGRRDDGLRVEVEVARRTAAISKALTRLPVSDCNPSGAKSGHSDASVPSEEKAGMPGDLLPNSGILDYTLSTPEKALSGGTRRFVLRVRHGLRRQLR